MEKCLFLPKEVFLFPAFERTGFEKEFHYSVFEQVIEDISNPSTCFQHGQGLVQKAFQSLDFIIEFNPKDLKELG